MRFCGICLSEVEYVYNMFKEHIGTPPQLLSKVITKCTRGTKRKYIRGGICQTCLNDLCIFYESLQTAKRIKRKIMELIARVDDSELNLNSTHPTAQQTYNNDLNSEGRMDIEIDTEEFSSTVNSETEDNLQGEIDEEQITNEPAIESYEKNYMNELMSSMVEDEKEPKAHSSDSDLDTEDEGEETGPICTECGESFSDYRSCKLHKAKLHPKKYVCQHCGKVLATSTGLQKHIQLHNPMKPLACQVCGKRYHFEVDLKNHEAWHTGERPYECHVCRKRFANFGSLSCHKIQHKPMPEGIECEICGKKFRKPSRLKNHMYTHAKEKNYKCPYCKYCTANKSALDWHLKNNKKCSALYQNDKPEDNEITLL